MKLNIALGIDDRYQIPARVLIESILSVPEHRNHHLSFWIVESSESHEFQRVVGQQIAGRANLQFVTAPEAYSGLPISHRKQARHATAAMYSRLLIPHILPPDEERVLYLDADTLCFDDLTPIFRSIDSMSALGAVCTGRIGDGGGIPGADAYTEIDAEAPYLNSGVLAIQCSHWRRREISERAWNYISDNSANLRYPDQDAINLSAYGEWSLIGERWNYTTPWRIPRSHESVAAIAAIAHCVGPLKWWMDRYPAGLVCRRWRELASRMETG